MKRLKENDKKTVEHVLLVDCPDCGRTIAYRGRCGKCGGNSWLPAGFSDRRVLNKVYREWLASRSTDFGELVEMIEGAKK